MPQIRGAAGSATNSPGVIIGCVLLALLVLGFFQQQIQKRKRRTRTMLVLDASLKRHASRVLSSEYHPPLQLQQSSTGVLEQIAKRKEDLRRYIGKLKEQLAAREDQLRYHDELEEIVTSRVETSRRDDEVRREHASLYPPTVSRF
jgi:type II secretory pathway pseudopilin PulG